MNKKRIGWIRKLGAVALSSLVALLLAELVVRSLDLDSPLVWVPHPQRGWQLVPGAERHWTEEGDGQVAINQLGYRDRERTRAKKPGTFRIAVFGDSQTEAVQVNLNQTFCYLLEERLSTPEQKVEVMNFGLSGFSPIQELLLMKKETPRFQPDLIVLALFLDNDVSGCLPELSVATSGSPFAIIGDDGELEFDYSRAQASFDDFQKEPKHTLRRLFGLYRMAYQIKSRLAMRAVSSDGNTDAPPLRYRLYETPLQSPWVEAWRILERVVLEIAEEAKIHNIPLVLVSVPAGQVVRASTWDRIVEEYPAMIDIKWDPAGPEIRLHEFARHHKMDLIQPYMEYSRAPTDPALFFGGIGHLTADGHAMLAAAIERHLRQRADAKFGEPAKSD